jgi:hypothetical protein
VRDAAGAGWREFDQKTLTVILLDKVTYKKESRVSPAFLPVVSLTTGI